MLNRNNVRPEKLVPSLFSRAIICHTIFRKYRRVQTRNELKLYALNAHRSHFSLTQNLTLEIVIVTKLDMQTYKCVRIGTSNGQL